MKGSFALTAKQALFPIGVNAAMRSFNKIISSMIKPKNLMLLILVFIEMGAII